MGGEGRSAVGISSPFVTAVGVAAANVIVPVGADWVIEAVLAALGAVAVVVFDSCIIGVAATTEFVAVVDSFVIGIVLLTVELGACVAV